jgi:arylsulfatase A-like enzyme
MALKRAGYATGITGKWGLGEPGSTGLPNDHGFDEWLGYLNQDHAPDYFTEFLWRNKEKMPLEGNRNNQQRQYSHDVLTEFALDFIRENRGGPFFLYVPYCIPHARYQIPSVAPYENEPWEDDAKVHAAMITRMDRDVGRILSLLKELDIDGGTIVFFCSDNGSARGWAGVFDSCGPLRAKKGSLHEGGIRTPMLVRWPGNTPAGKVSDVPWYFADVLPTLADLAGATPPDSIDGVSVLPTLLGRAQSIDRFLYWEKVKSGVLWQAVRWGRWKALRKSRGDLELYDVTRDIGETRNVAAGHAEVVARITEFLRNVRTETPHWPTKG